MYDVYIHVHNMLALKMRGSQAGTKNVLTASGLVQNGCRMGQLMLNLCQQHCFPYCLFSI